jgi:hypothetical protein
MNSETRWIHVSFSWPTGGEAAKFEEVFNKAKDWIKYSRNCWLLHTKLDINVWRDRVRAIPGMNDQNIFVVEVEDPIDGVTGYLPEWMWKKLQKDE